MSDAPERIWIETWYADISGKPEIPHFPSWNSDEANEGERQTTEYTRADLSPQWQPIDDKYECACLLFVEDAGDEGEIAIGTIWKSPATGKLNVKARGYMGTWNITKFMPLPKPPT